MSLQQDNMQDFYLNYNIIHISKKITQEYAEEIIKQLLFLNKITAKCNVLHIYLSTNGGNANGMLEIINIMNLIKKTRPIATYCMSITCSAGVDILSNGTKGYRYMADNSFIMAHSSIGWIPYKDAEDKEINIDISKKQEELYFKIFSENTGQKIATIKKDLRRDKWFTADEALDYGIVDHIIARNDMTLEQHEQSINKNTHIIGG